MNANKPKPKPKPKPNAHIRSANSTKVRKELLRYRHQMKQSNKTA